MRRVRVHVRVRATIFPRVLENFSKVSTRVIMFYSAIARTIDCDRVRRVCVRATIFPRVLENFSKLSTGVMIFYSEIGSELENQRFTYSTVNLASIYYLEKQVRPRAKVQLLKTYCLKRIK